MNNSAGDILKFNINFYVKYSSEIFTYIYENEATTTELMNLLMNKKIMNKTSYINLRKSISSFLSRVKN